MNIIFILNFIVTLMIFFLIAINFFKHYKKERIRKIINYFFVIGLLYLFMSIFSLLWGIDSLTYKGLDFILIYSLIILVQTVFLLFIAYEFSKNKNVFYFLFFYLLVFISIFYNQINLMGIFLIASFLLSLLFFINLAVRFDTYRIVGYLGIFYSLTAFCFWASNLLGLGDSFILSIFSNLVFLILVYYFVKDVKAYVPARHYKDKKEHYILVLFRYFVFVAVVVNFVFLGTLGVHEFGHYTTSKFYDCSYQSIIYEGNLPKTEVLCDDLSDINIILLGGIFLPIIFVILLFFVGNKFLRELGFLILGFQLIASYRDLLDLGISENLSFGLSFIGFLCLMVGIVLIIRSRTQEYAHSIL